MPELPEVETVRRGLEPAMLGARIVKVEQRRPDLRFPLPEKFPARLTGRTIVGLGRRAKYLLVDLDDGMTLIMHLGMSGSFRVESKTAAPEIPGDFHHERSVAEAHDHVVFHLSTGFTITYNDPRRFGFMDLTPRAELDQHPSFKSLGMEPLGNEMNGDRLADLLKGRKAPLKAALLDQRLIAGLGNIYVCEALNMACLSPKRKAGTLARRNGAPTPAAVRLADDIRAVLQKAILAGGSSLRDHKLTDGSLGYFQHHFRVYDREGEPCPTPGCGGTVRRIVQSGRSTFYCAKCQK
jgi:formamidopyrimidine-DNA glycosylase